MASRINSHTKVLLLMASCALGTFFAAGLSSDAFQQAHQQEKPADPHAAIRANNLGAAYLNQQRMEQALAQFKQAQSADPKLAAARMNEAIALLNLQRIEPARALLGEIVAQEPRNIRAWYNLGLLEKNSGDAEKALAAFERAASLDPDDPDTHYFIGTLHSQLQKYDAAIAAFQRAIQLNPFHVSAEFGLARAQQRLGNAEHARLHLARFQHLNTEKLGAPMSLAYGDQGQYSLAETVTPPPSAAPPPIPVKFTPVPASESGLRLARLGHHNLVPPVAGEVCVLDQDGDGLDDAFVATSMDWYHGRVFRNFGKEFADITFFGGESTGAGAQECTTADFDNDGRTDVALLKSGMLFLLRNTDYGRLEDATPKNMREVAAGRDQVLIARDQVFVDFDHDGDLDLLLVGNRNRLWRNNGDGSFTESTQEKGIGVVRNILRAIPSDYNNDRAVDLILAAKTELTILENKREGSLHRVTVTNPFPSPIRDVAVLDFDNDSWMDIALAAGKPTTIALLRNRRGGTFEKIAQIESEESVGAIAAFDYDNDGWTDLVLRGTGVQIARNNGLGGFAPASKLYTPSPALPLTSVAAFDFANDGAPDLVAVPFFKANALGLSPESHSLIVLRNEGADQNNWLKLSLKGLADNKSAIGTKVEVFAGASYQKFEVTTPNDLLIGLGQEKQADVVRLLWPTGVLQDEVNLAANQRHEIMQIDRRGSSCPVLFAWNGTRYEFIADAIGPGIVGHWVAPGMRNTSDPTEYIKVPGSLLRERRGANGERLLSFRFAEPMEEIVYLDQLRLFAIDHPSGTDVNPSERFYASGPPFPTGEPVFTQQSNARPPVSARDHRGRDVTELLRTPDRRYVSDFAAAPYKGFAELHWIEFDLGEAAQTTAQDPVGAPLAAPLDAAHPRGFGVRRLDAALFSRDERKDGNGKSLASASELAKTGRDDARLQPNGAQQAAPLRGEARPLRLLLHGYTDYFTATSVYAAHQGGVTAIVPYVEALTPEGKWVRIVNDMGFPAGLARTMVADLTGKLPPGTQRIRIATNLKIYWDQILIDTTPEGTPHRTSEAPLAAARAGYLGYPREIRGTPASDIHYDYHTVSATGPYARAAGHYTRYGDVRALAAGADDRFVLMGSGDEVAVEFDAAALPPVPAGWTRDWFFYVDGFAKDMDFYAAHPFTVTPLPYHAMPGYPYSDEHRYPNHGPHLEDQLELNTRAVSGRPAPSYRYAYPK